MERLKTSEYMSQGPVISLCFEGQQPILLDADSSLCDFLYMRCP